MLPSLRVIAGSACEPLPAWARYLAELGGTVGVDSQAGGRLVVAVGLPTRVYAASIIGAGIVAARTTLQPVADGSAHFAGLCAAPPGTPVLLEIGGRRTKGALLGPLSYRGEKWARVKLENGETHSVCEAEALRITIPSTSTSARSSEQRSATTLVQRRAFLRQSLGRAALTNITRESRMECVLVGRRSVLCHEATELQVAVPSAADPRRMQRARLSDVLRIRKLLRGGQPYRSEVVSSIGRRAPADAGDDPPFAVVFDGATGFLKWRHLWPQANWVVALDHTEPRCDEAAAAVDALYQDRGVGGPVPVLLPELPGQVDLAAFRVPVAGRGGKPC